MLKLIANTIARVAAVYFIALLVFGTIAFMAAPSLFGFVFISSGTISAVYGLAVMLSVIMTPVTYLRERKIAKNTEIIDEEYDVNFSDAVNEKEAENVAKRIKRIIAEAM